MPRGDVYRSAVNGVQAIPPTPELLFEPSQLAAICPLGQDINSELRRRVDERGSGYGNQRSHRGGYQRYTTGTSDRDITFLISLLGYTNITSAIKLIALTDAGWLTQGLL